MLFKNGRVYTDQNCYANVDVRVADGMITEVGHELSAENEDVLDLRGKRLLPGLIEIHSHGCGGADFCDGTEEAFSTLASHYIKNGITTVLGTSMTLPLERLSEIYQAYAKFARGQGPNGARMIGVHMEGPFLSKEKRGAHDETWIIPADIDAFDRLMRNSGNRIKIVSVAPEVSGNMRFIKDAAALCTVSIAHTNADYATAMDAYDKGATSTTHLFNAMTPMLHRAPGVVGAALDSGSFLELICDGHHVLPPVVRAMFAAAGDRICCISDSMRAAGMPEGRYSLGGQTVTVKDGLATLADGTIAGSVTNLFSELKLLIEWGIPEEQAIRSVTSNPARAAKIDAQVGSITPGKHADLLIVDDNFRLEAVYRDGVRQI